MYGHRSSSKVQASRGCACRCQKVSAVSGIQNSLLLLQRVTLREARSNELGVDHAVDHDVSEVDVARLPSSRAMLCAKARKTCLAPENAAKFAEPRNEAVAPVNRIVPRSRRTMRLATSRAG